MKHILFVILSIACISCINPRKSFILHGNLSAYLSAYEDGSEISGINLKHMDGTEYAEEYTAKLESDGKYMIEGAVSEPVAMILEITIDVPGGKGTSRLCFIAEPGDIYLDAGSRPSGTELNESVFEEIDQIISQNDTKNILRLIEESSPLAQAILHDTAVRLKAQAEKEDHYAKTSPGQMYIDFKGTYKGEEVMLSEYIGKGKHVILDFWASWCGPCREKIPELIELYGKHKDKGLEIIGIAVSDKPENTLKMIDRMDIPYPQIFDTDGTAAKEYGISTIPEIILISAEGRILARGNESATHFISKHLNIN